MAFFEVPQAVIDRPKITGRQAAAPGNRERRATFDPMQRGCDVCPMKQRWSTITSPRMAMTGNTIDPSILVLLPNPNELEDRSGKHLVGELYAKFRKLLPARMLEDMAFVTVARCAINYGSAPDDISEPTAPVVHACSIHLEADIERLPFKVVLAVGDAALMALVPGLQMRAVHGTRVPIKIGGKTVWVFPVFHPEIDRRFPATFGEGPYMPIVREDLKRLFASWRQWPPAAIAPLPDVLMPASAADARAILARMRGSIAVDIETTGLKPYVKDMRLLTAAFSDGKVTCAWPISHVERPTDWGLSLLLETVRDRPWIAHNAAMELLWFTYWAKELNLPTKFAPFDDTMALLRLHHQRATINGLETASVVHLGHNVKTMTKVNRTNVEASPVDEVMHYNGLDAWSTALIYQRLFDKRQVENYNRITESVYATVGMELLGLPFDIERSRAIRAEWQAKRDDCLTDVRRIYEVRRFEIEKQKEFNIASAKDVGDALVEFGNVKLPRTAKGAQYASDDDALNKAAPDNPLVKAVLLYRTSEKMMATYCDPFERALELHVDGLLHPSYTVMLTATLRLSSNDPNIQNFPKRKFREVRSQIVAPPGHVLVAFDYGQLEARVLAMATRDRLLCRSILEGQDIHSYWLDKVLAAYPEYLTRLAEKSNLHDDWDSPGSNSDKTAFEKEVRKHGRDVIKTDFVFSSFYGSGVNSISAKTGIPKPIVEKVHIDFWGGFGGVKAWIKQRRDEYRDRGIATTLTGRIRHTVLTGNEPINTPIQGTGADIVVDAMNELSSISREWNDPYIHPRMQIHDDLTFILPEDDRLDAYISIISEVMLRVRYKFQIVPLIVEAKVGYDWSEMHEFAVFKGDYVK